MLEFLISVQKFYGDQGVSLLECDWSALIQTLDFVNHCTQDQYWALCKIETTYRKQPKTRVSESQGPHQRTCDELSVLPCQRGCPNQRSYETPGQHTATQRYAHLQARIRSCT